MVDKFLSKIAQKLNCIKDSEKYEEEANYVKKYINKNMYDIKTGYYYDLQINQDKYKLLVNRDKGTEGFISLWANISTKEEAKAVRDNVQFLRLAKITQSMIQIATGEGLHATNFSWSAAAYYLIYTEVL